jgi:hypothetical protein
MNIDLSSLPRTFLPMAIGLLCLGTSPGCRDARAEGPEVVRIGSSSAEGAGALHPVTIYRAHPSLGMNTGEREHDGMAARAPCGTCHGFVAPKDKYVAANKLEDFHKGVEILHGGQSCRTCHSVPGFEAFNLAGGESVSHEEVMRLCGQCHAQRLVEYERGAHGGMTGYWDLSRGPRSRNHCLDCHNPHAPAVPPMVPAPAPIYRTFD